MAEEIADLTNSRDNDIRYKDNIIFDENGLQDLLQHIKDYPVINVEYVDENATDALNPDFNIWKTYTEGTPCVKITFGDENNVEGNLTAEVIEEIKQLEQQLTLITGVKSIYDKYSGVESEYKGLIRNIYDELNQILDNVYDIYHKQLNTDKPGKAEPDAIEGDGTERGNKLSDTNIVWNGSYYKVLLDKNNNLLRSFRHENSETLDNGFVVDRFKYKVFYTVNNFIEQLETLIENYNIIDDSDFYRSDIEDFDPTVDIINNNVIDEQHPVKYIVPFGGNNNNWENTSDDLAAFERDSNFNFETIENIKNKFQHYNDVLIKTDQLLMKSFAPVPEGSTFNSNITYFIYDNGQYKVYTGSEFEPNKTYYYRTDNDHIRTLLKKYISYIRAARADCYETIRKFLIANLDSANINPVLYLAITEYDTDTNSKYSKVSQYIANKYLSSTAEQELKNNIINKKTEIITDKYQIANTQNNSEEKYYIQDANGHFVFYANGNAVDEDGHSKFNSNTTYYTLKENAAPAIYGYKYVKVGSNIIFKDTNLEALKPIETTTQATGTFRVSIDTKEYEVPIKGLAGGEGAINFSGHLLPSQTDTFDIGGDRDTEDENKLKWRNLYLSNNANIDGMANIGGLTINNRVIASTMLPTTTSDSAHFWRGDGIWSNELGGRLIIQEQGLQSTTGNEASKYSTGTYKPTGANNMLHVVGNGLFDGNLSANKVFNAVFNDYAECRTTIDLAPGHVVVDNDDGTLSCSSKRLQPGAQVISDTFGHSMGETDTAKTHIAVAGRVLVYTYQPRENYHAGMAVCSAPDGTIDIMTREEICQYPDCIIGIVSEIPQYKYWGTDNVKVDNRIWIKIK